MTLRRIYLSLLISVVLGACTSPRTLLFADRRWHVSPDYGQIIDEDTCYRLTFGEVLIPADLMIISSADSLAKYPGLGKFMADILHTAGLDGAEILFYAPHMQSFFVVPAATEAAARPSSITSNMDERPYTMWTYASDPEDWRRRTDEMYTYTYYNKRKKQLLIVSRYDYNGTPIAQIRVLQSATRRTARMGLERPFVSAFYSHNLAGLARDIEFWANTVDGHRVPAIANYRIGRYEYFDDGRVARAVAQGDSALLAGNPEMALKTYRPCIIYGRNVDNRVRYNAACAASLCGEADYGLGLLRDIADRDSSWYLNEPLDPDLINLKSCSDWHEFDSINSGRRARIEANCGLEGLRR